MSAAALESALATVGCEARVEARGRLAVLIASELNHWMDEYRRELALRLAAEHGFSHIALELGDERSDAATVHRPEPAR